MAQPSRPPLPRPIDAGDFDALIKNDVELYPTENPLTPAVLSKWFAHHPEFGMMYDGFGCCVFVPLVPSTWQRFIRKEIEEADLVDGIFDAAASASGDLCLHLYHIEKTSQWSRAYDRMANVVLDDVRMLIARLNASRPSPLAAIRVVGCSALAASDAGFKMSRDVFHMTLLFEPEEFLYRHRQDGHVAIFQKSDVISDSEWIKIGEARLMAVEGEEACANVF
ncbi:Aste57867_15135 [Aphanomyces stellatus]|uniref:Aste57867_15135 protein n=1 Tax=Aphanomyces stellatus TaxID=120398 RepID=A0A485L2H2_9STRA|nr:hypothetical protein As57867_015079 [Aphanomyces stellatus]VFT91945.1 Aste57867_15135 [Aphanomyces stellatus]